MMMGLRLTREGVSRAAFQARFGRELVEVFGRQIERLDTPGPARMGRRRGGYLTADPPGKIYRQPGVRGVYLEYENCQCSLRQYEQLMQVAKKTFLWYFLYR